MTFLSSVAPELNRGTVMLVSCDKGIGSLISENGRILFCRNNHGGELGHSVSVPDGDLCTCGRRGCLETVSSIPALLKKCREKLQRNDIGFEDICTLFQNDDPTVNAEVRELAKYLGTAVSNQLNTCPTDKLMITGKILQLGENFCRMLEKYITDMLFSYVKSSLTITFTPPIEDNHAAAGAAILANNLAELLQKNPAL